MDGLVILGGEVVEAGDVVAAVGLGGGDADLVGIALGNDAAGCDQGDRGVPEVLDGSAGRDLLEGRHLVLGLERLALELPEQHVDDALGAVFLVKENAAEAAADVVFVGGGAERFLPEQLERQRRHGFGRVFDAAGAVGRLDDEDFLGEGLGAGILGIHAGDDGNAQRVLHGGADVAAGHAVASGEERRAGDQQVGLVAADHLEQRLFGLFVVFVEVVVAADHRADDLGVFAQLGLKGGAGADFAVALFGRHVGHVLAADAGVKLVDVMNDAERHDRSLLTPRASRTC